jgi:hypothetical protein
MESVSPLIDPLLELVKVCAIICALTWIVDRVYSA